MIPPHFVQSRLLLRCPGVYHAFLGVDPVPGRATADLLREVFSVPPARIGTLRQVHSGLALEVGPEDLGRPEAGGREGDALWTGAPGTGAGVRTADCVPVLLALPGPPLAAAVHAGWRGLSAGIVGSAVRAIAGRFGDGAVGRLVAAAGPGARGCCYEVGDEVAGLLAELPGGGRHVRKGAGGTGRWRADLQGLVVEALAAAGLSPSRVESVGPCTICAPRFHSFRREKSLTGRQLSFIYIL